MLTCGRNYLKNKLMIYDRPAKSIGLPDFFSTNNLIQYIMSIHILIFN